MLSNFDIRSLTSVNSAKAYIFRCDNNIRVNFLSENRFKIYTKMFYYTFFSAPFCFSLYKDIINMPAGPVIWAFLKPMLLGKILYAPYTPITKAIMEKV